jgi:hypothetical protein
MRRLKPWIQPVRLGIALMIGGFCLFSSSSPSEAGEDRVKQLEAQVASIEASNRDLRTRVVWLESLVRGTTHVGMSYEAVEVDPDVEKQRLEGIVLPDSPTEDQVRSFVAEVLGATLVRGRVFTASDPAIRHLLRVGPEHVAVLLEALDTLNMVPMTYVIEALKALARDRHKEMIIERLRRHPDLVGVVRAKNWTKEAAPILLATVAQRLRSTETSWIELAATVAGPKNYSDLLWHVLHGVNPWPTWKAVRGLPGMERLLTAEIPGAWEAFTKSPQFSDVHHRRQLARVAIHYGVLDALAVVAKEAASSGGESMDLFQRLTGYEGQREDAYSWYQREQLRLRFNPATGRYELEP